MGREAKKMELLAPAGGMDQLKAACAFGADAVYLAGRQFGMRAKAANFSDEELPEAVKIAHSQGAQVHLTCNIMMMEDDLNALPLFLELAQDAGVDALIIGDMGAFALAKRYAPKCKLHVSTQASVANSEAAKAWHALGATRIVCAREMTLQDISNMRQHIPDDLEIEAFAHGAQCMAVSGRCLISSYLTSRSGNRGECTQPCRWSYTLEEEKRRGLHFPVEEDGTSTFIMNAKDLNMAAHLQDLANAGVDSIKIEGRNKKAFYVASVVAAYRRALDAGHSDDIQQELAGISHRPYSTGFFYGSPEQATDFDGYEQETMHVADVLGTEDGRVFARCRNRFAEGEELEALTPRRAPFKIQVDDLKWHPEEQDPRSQAVDVANRSCATYSFKLAPDAPVPEAGSFLRVRRYRRSSRH